MKSIDLKVMVFIFSIFFCSFISNRNMKKNNSTIKTLSKDEGSGSWDTFYDCPSILAKNEKGEYIDYGSAKIYKEE